MSTQVGLFITGTLLFVGISYTAMLGWQKWRRGRFTRGITKRRINLAKRRGL